MIKFVQVPCPSSCPSSGSSGGEFSYPNIFCSSGCLVIKKSSISEQERPDSRQPPIPQLRGPGRKPELGQELGQGTWTSLFSSCRATCPSSPGELTRTWTRNLDKFYHVFSSCRATCPSSPGELGQGTWTTAGRVTSSLSITPRFQAGPDSTTSWPRAETRALSLLHPRFQASSDSREAPIPCASPRRKPELGQELGQGTWTNFITCFPLAEPLVQVRPGNLDKELGQPQAAL